LGTYGSLAPPFVERRHCYLYKIFMGGFPT
jgi:hypothetical protein